MANYYSWTKTNWFRINDEFRFKHILFNLRVFGEGLYDDHKLIHSSHPDKDGYFYHKLMCYGDLCGPYNKELGDYEDIEKVLYKPLQDLLPTKEDVFVLKYIGAEKLRYVDAGYTIVTKENIVYNHIDRLISTEVSELTGLNDINIDFDYRDSSVETIEPKGDEW